MGVFKHQSRKLVYTEGKSALPLSLLNVDLVDLGPLLLDLGDGDDEEAVLHPGGDAHAVDVAVLLAAGGGQGDGALEGADAPLGGGGEGLEEGLVARAVDDAGDGEGGGVRVPVDADVLLLGAGEGGVEDVGGRGVEDVDGGGEGLVFWAVVVVGGGGGVVVAGAGAALLLGVAEVLDLLAQVLDEGVASQVAEGLEHGREVEGRGWRGVVRASVGRRWWWGEGEAVGRSREGMVVVRRRASVWSSTTAAVTTAPSSSSASSTARASAVTAPSWAGTRPFIVVRVLGGDFLWIGCSSGAVVVHHGIRGGTLLVIDVSLCRPVFSRGGGSLLSRLPVIVGRSERVVTVMFVVTPMIPVAGTTPLAPLLEVGTGAGP
ncbi:unnamed protein product [Clonostachys solani]|uniref:Uncharacterized protein n=1 Tax=Clonostachys solani TaxID=160281 RepID=A0A9P0EHJ0_9HYPO|nr:unnamed protein product [Clonostachys solani]